MSTQDPIDLEGAPATPDTVSRRTLMKTAGGVGIAAAVGYAGIAHATGAHSAGTAANTGTPLASAAGAPRHVSPGRVAGPVVVHLTDLENGLVEVFTPTSSHQVTDHDLAARIARAATR